MGKPRRKWPDHPLVGLKTTFKHKGSSSPVEVVDVRSGPMLLDTSSMDQPEARIEGTIELRLRHLDSGAEFWSPPMKWDGKSGKQRKAVSNG